MKLYSKPKTWGEAIGEYSILTGLVLTMSSYFILIGLPIYTIGCLLILCSNKIQKNKLAWMVLPIVSLLVFYGVIQIFIDIGG